MYLSIYIYNTGIYTYISYLYLYNTGISENDVILGIYQQAVGFDWAENHGFQWLLKHVIATNQGNTVVLREVAVY